MGSPPESHDEGAEETDRTRRNLRLAGVVTLVGGAVVAVPFLANLLLSTDLSRETVVRNLAMSLGGAGLAIEGLLQVRDPSPPESDRERALALLRTTVSLGLVFSTLLV